MKISDKDTLEPNTFLEVWYVRRFPYWI